MTDDFPIDARFAPEAKVGRGASGDVFRARDKQTGQTVAVKRLGAVHDDPVMVDRFRREARLLAQIDDPHVVRYVAHGIDSGGRPCLVVEWLEGEDLSRRQKRARLSIPQALDVARQAALGLHALHQAGIVHRDVKPSNLYLVTGPDGSLQVKVIDLGIARAATEATLTTHGVALGTPFYMAPEQARGEERVSHRADVFSLGVVIFELVAGRRPFAGDDFFAVIAKIVLQDPPRLREVVPGVPADLDAVVRRAMSKLAEDRFGSARDLAEALASLPPWDGSPMSGPVEIVPEAPTSRAAAALSATLEQRVVTALFTGFAAPITLHGGAPVPAPSPGDAEAQAFAAIAEAHGGAAYPTLGRRMIAVFGGARTTGDEVMRAARAALTAAEAIPGLQLAIATGRALAGLSGLSGDLIERGAKEIEGRQGQIRLDAATARLLADHFVVEDRVLTGVRPAAGAPRTLVGKATPLVGRDRELKTLLAAFDECVSEPVARAVVVSGPAGIGKSRLRYELLAHMGQADQKPEVILGRGSLIAVDSAFGLLGPAIRRLAGILDGEPAADQRRKLGARLGGRIPRASVDLLGDLAGVPREDAGAQPKRDAVLTGDLMRAAWIEWLEAECADHPVAIVMEDVHWGDRASVAFVGAALRALPDAPLLVVALGRPEMLDRFPDLWGEHSALGLRLGPLTAKAAERLVRSALGAEVSDAVVKRIVGRAEGNAFFLEELIRAISEGAQDELPDTVLGMVQARLDALGPELKKVLRAASVFGQTFWRGGIAALLGEPPKSVGEAIQRLITAELVARRDGAGFPGEEELVFRHALVRDAAYAMIADDDRRTGHRLAGAFLESAGELSAAILAAHFEQGGDAARAARFYLQAAEKALGGNDFTGAVGLAERAVACGSEGEDRGRARLIQAEAQRWRADLGAAAQAAAEAAELLPHGAAVWYQAVRESIAANGRLGRFDLVMAWGEEAINAEASPEAVGARIAALAPAAGQMIYSGNSGGAATFMAEIDRARGAAGDLDPVVNARVEQLLALKADHDRDLEGAERHFAATLASFEAAGDRRGACLALSNLGFVRAQLGFFSEAEEALTRVHATATRMGLGTIAPLALHNLGGVLGALGKLDEARAAEEEAVRAFEKAGDPRLTGASRVYLARILLAAGEKEKAEAEARRVAESSASPPPLRAGAQAMLAQSLLAQQRVSEAVEIASTAAEALASLGAVEDFEAAIGLAHAEALFAGGDRPGAEAAIANACRRVLARAERLHEPARASFLGVVPDNARCLALAREWGVAIDGASRL